MRHVVLLSFFVCLYLHFQSSKNNSEQIDTLSTHQAAATKVSSGPEKLTPPASALVSVQKNSLPKLDEEVVNNEIDQDYDQDDLSQLPWDEIEEGWKSQLKDFLVSVDPERAQDIFAAYLETKKKYVEKIDYSDLETPLDASVDHNEDQGEIERLHTESLKDVFGEYYSQVETLHRDYVESVQYLNRTSVKFTISL